LDPSLLGKKFFFFSGTSLQEEVLTACVSKNPHKKKNKTKQNIYINDKGSSTSKQRKL